MHRNNVLCCTVLYFALLENIALYCTILYCTVLYCTVLHRNVPHCSLPPFPLGICWTPCTRRWRVGTGGARERRRRTLSQSQGGQQVQRTGRGTGDRDSSTHDTTHTTHPFTSIPLLLLHSPNLFSLFSLTSLVPPSVSSIAFTFPLRHFKT